jgi:hypothetical protein
MAQQPAYDTVISLKGETQKGETPEDEYLAHYLAPLSQAIEADLDSLTVTLSEMDKADAPRDKSAPPIEELLDVALGQRTEEHQAELRRQVKHAVHTVAQQAAHLEVRAEEVARLESVIHEFKDASQREEIHLKSEIAALQGQVAELEVWRARALELEGSTLWRMMAPVRLVLHRIKLFLRAVP